jgi:Brp/Blh family beta-carotene 15,15'-monooxygenase
MALAFPALVGLGLAIVDRKTPFKCRLEFACTALAAFFLEPIPFFILYFCTQHSPRHLIETCTGLPARHLLPTAIAFTLLAIGMAVLVYEVLPTVPKTDGIVQVVFVGLAILTVPHMLLVEAAATRASHSRPASGKNATE